MAETEKPVLARSDGPIRILTLNRPARRNAFKAGSYRLLGRLLEEADADPEMRVVVLRGAEPAFSSGVDLDALAGGADAADDLGETFHSLLETLTSLTKPLIAAVRGVAVGFGATILLHCDMVLVADDARLRFPFTSLGTSPEAGSSLLLPSVVGPQQAADLLYTSRWVEAPEAVALGLALRKCAPDELDDDALQLARAIADQPPAAVAGVKRLLRAGWADAVRAATEREEAEAELLTAELGPLGGLGTTPS